MISHGRNVIDIYTKCIWDSLLFIVRHFIKIDSNLLINDKKRANPTQHEEGRVQPPWQPHQVQVRESLL